MLLVARAHCMTSALAYAVKPFDLSCDSRRCRGAPRLAFSFTQLPNMHYGSYTVRHNRDSAFYNQWLEEDDRMVVRRD